MDRLVLLTRETLEANPAVGADAVEAALRDLGNPVVIGDPATLTAFPSRPRFPSLLGLCLHLCRGAKLLKNDRTSFLSQADVHLLASDCLRRRKGDEDVEVSDVLDVLRIVAKSRCGKEESELTPNLAEMNDATSLAAKDYEEVLKTCNLVDSHKVIQLVRGNLDEIRKMLEMRHCLMLCPALTEERSVEKELFEMLASDQVKIEELVAETSLDASVNENAECVLSLRTLESLPACPGLSLGATASHCRSVVSGHLGLLLNSRDELSLAKAASGPSGLARADFAAIRKESRKTSMPMFQTVVSYVQKARLGGKSYAPTDSHPFAPFAKQLEDLVGFHEKLQSKVEEERSPAGAMRKVLAGLRSHLSSSCPKSHEAMERICKTAESAEVTMKAMEANTSAKTPKRDVGSGGSLAGRQNLKLLRLLLDCLSSHPAATSLHELLGKIPSQSNATSAAKTPLPGLQVSKLLRTPAEKEVDEEEAEKDTEKRVEPAHAVTIQEKGKKLKPGMPKFHSTLSWAPETSPAVAEESPLTDRDVGGVARRAMTRVSGPTLVAKGTESPICAPLSPVVEEEVEEDKENEVLKEARNKAEQAIADSKALRRRAPKSKLPKKRSILKEIGNLGKDDAVSTKKSPVKKRTKQNQPALIKGQTRLTAFFTKS